MSKHKQTEGKLGQQAWKLVFMNDEFEQDLEKLHNKLSKVKYIEGDNKDTKSDFNPFLEVMDWWARCVRRWTCGARSTGPAAICWGAT